MEKLARRAQIYYNMSAKEKQVRSIHMITVKEHSPYEFMLDMHMHTVASGHAYGTIREMAQAASAKGLSFIGISEHGPGIPGTCDPIYFTNLKVVPRTLYGVKLLHGCETNVLNDGTVSLEQERLEKLDYGIAGIHKQCYRDEGREKNTDNVISCMKNSKIFMISHPDDDHMPLDYERLVPASGKYHTALELNNSSLLKPDKRLNCVENYKHMLRLCEQYRIPIVVNSDAHDPSYVGRFDEAIALLQELKFDPELILNTSVERFLKFIGRLEDK